MDRTVALIPDGLLPGMQDTEIDEWLGRYRALWEQRLDALHTEIARGKRERRSTR